MQPPALTEEAPALKRLIGAEVGAKEGGSTRSRPVLPPAAGSPAFVLGACDGVLKGIMP
jgi:hypothetical protein